MSNEKHNEMRSRINQELCTDDNRATIQRSIHRISLSMEIVIPVIPANAVGGKFIRQPRRFRDQPITAPPIPGDTNRDSFFRW